MRDRESRSLENCSKGQFYVFDHVQVSIFYYIIKIYITSLRTIPGNAIYHDCHVVLQKN